MAESFEIWSVGFLDRGYTALEPVNCGHHRCPPLHTGYGRRTYYMLHYVRKGRGMLYSEAGEFPVEAGQMFLVLPGENARYVADPQDPWEYTWVSFNGTLAKKLDSLPTRVAATPQEPFDILRTLKNRPDTREEMAAATLFMIFAELFTGSSSRPHYVRRTVQTVDSLYMTPLRVEAIAHSLGIDRRYLARIFKASMGISVQEYLLQVRMEQAKKLLRDGLPVNQVAGMVGYNDPFQFSKIFKKHCLVSPGKYKG